MNNSFLKKGIVIALALCTGALFKITISRSQLPYENGRFFDSTQSVVYEQQAVELYAFATVVLLCLTVAVAFRIFKNMKK